VPTTDQLLTGLAAISREWWPVAVLWHAYIGALAASLLLGLSGLLYGVTGVARLGVLIDAGLLLGAVVIQAVGLWGRQGSR